MAAKKLSLPVLNWKGEEVGKVDLAPEVFGLKEEERNPQVVKDAVTVYLANLRQATAKTKKRHEIHGTGKKPYRQKGTGRARAGDVKSPIWVGGGNVFGPDGTQNYKLKQNKKEHNLALRNVWTEKVANGGVVVVENLNWEKASSKDAAAALKALKAEGKVLVAVNGEEENLILSFRNVDNLGLTEVNNVSVYDVLYFDKIVISKDDIKKIEEALK
ncbi:MAG: 50S ribosomal protein L4 [Bacilli bacterium]|nr:50S ribosomal protein L4 [Bacilli bacterium]